MDPQEGFVMAWALNGVICHPRRWAGGATLGPATLSAAIRRIPRQPPAVPRSIVSSVGDPEPDGASLLARVDGSPRSKCPEGSSPWAGRDRIHGRFLAENCHWRHGAVRLRLVSCVDPGHISPDSGSIRVVP